MTKQEAFDIVWDWFVVKAKRPSRSADKTCMYLNPTNGARCAVGVLLPKPLLKKLIEAGHNGDAVDDMLFGPSEASGEALAFLSGLLDKKEPEDEDDDSQYDLTFITDLQNCHDSPADHCETLKEFTEETKSKLINFGQIYGLAVPA